MDGWINCHEGVYLGGREDFDLNANQDDDKTHLTFGGQDLAFLTDIQHTTFQHTIVIQGKESGQTTYSQCVLTCYLSTNTHIDSVQCLTTYLGGASFACTG